MGNPTAPTSCSAYIAAGNLSTTTNKLTFSATTTATVGWLQANDCKTDLYTQTNAAYTALVAAGSWTGFTSAPFNYQSSWFDGSYSDGLLMYTTLTYTPAAEQIIMLCVSQSGATSYSCTAAQSADSGATYTKFSVALPSTYITYGRNFFNDYYPAASATTPTATQTAIIGYLKNADAVVFMNGGSWLCSPQKQNTQVTISCARFLPTTTLSSGADYRFVSTQSTTVTLWSYDYTTGILIPYQTPTLSTVSKNALGLLTGSALAVIATLIF